MYTYNEYSDLEQSPKINSFQHSPAVTCDAMRCHAAASCRLWLPVGATCIGSLGHPPHDGAQKHRPTSQEDAGAMKSRDETLM